MPINTSPSIISPLSSTTTRRSASPSNAKPTSARKRFTSSAKFCGCSAPQFSLIFLPFGLLLSTITSAPSSLKIVGATLYAAPFATSNTMRSLRSVRPCGNELLICTIQRPITSSTRFATPISMPSLAASLIKLSSKKYFSISASLFSSNLKPVLSKNLMPLS